MNKRPRKLTAWIFFLFGAVALCATAACEDPDWGEERFDEIHPGSEGYADEDEEEEEENEPGESDDEEATDAP